MTGPPALVRLLRNGDPVDAGSVNRPIRGIDENVSYLLDLLNAAATGSTVYAHRQTVEAEARVGMAVYLNPATAKFERGLAVAVADGQTGLVSTAPSTQVWGIVAAKHTSESAEILLFGVDTVDLTGAVDGAVTPGTYYLSSTSPGRLVKNKPPVSVPVLRVTTDGRVFVQPQFVDYLDRHSHLKFGLSCRPAGRQVVTEGGPHTIVDTDSNISGWLPANDPAFAGMDVPAGAVFGYNVAADPGLDNAWPPTPETAYLEWNKGLSADVGFTGVPLGPDGLCVVNRDGIWWLSNCYGDVPWPVDFGVGYSDSLSDSAGPECPRRNPMAMTLYMTKGNTATDATAVLSLTSDDTRIKVRCADGIDRPATAGHLKLLLDLNLVVVSNKTGYTALKTFNPDTSTFESGPVVEGLYTTSDNVTLSGTVSGSRTVNAQAVTVHQGLVNVTVNPAPTATLDVQLVRLDGVTEASWGTPPNMYIGFPAGRRNEYRAKVSVPADLAIDSPVMTLRFQILGRAAGTLPSLEFSVRRVSRPTAGLTTPVTLPDDSNEDTITCNTAAVLASGNKYVEAETEAFEVAAGDTVFFSVRRLAGDAYAGELGILRQEAVIRADT